MASMQADPVARAPLTKLQAAGEFIEASVKLLADDWTIVLLKEGADLQLSGVDRDDFSFHHARAIRLLDGLVEMAREMKAA